MTSEVEPEILPDAPVPKQDMSTHFAALLKNCWFRVDQRYTTRAGELRKSEHLKKTSLFSRVLFGILTSGLFLMLLAFFVSSVVIFYANDTNGILQQPTSAYVGTAFCSLLVVFFACFFIYTVKKDVHLMFVQTLWHRLHHRLRDKFYKTLHSDFKDQNEQLKSCMEFSFSICQDIRELWEEVLHERGNIGVCIRIAHKNNNDGLMEYETFGRSPNLDNSAREIRPSTLNANEGVVRIICREPQGKVLLIRDVKNAHIFNTPQDLLWSWSQNDDFDDIRSVLIAPINFSEKEGGKIKTCGILYITSDRSWFRSPFSSRNVQLVSALADSLGCIYPHLIPCYRPAVVK